MRIPEPTSASGLEAVFASLQALNVAIDGVTHSARLADAALEGIGSGTDPSGLVVPAYLDDPVAAIGNNVYGSNQPIADGGAGVLLASVEKVLNVADPARLVPPIPPIPSLSKLGHEAERLLANSGVAQTTAKLDAIDRKITALQYDSEIAIQSLFLLLNQFDLVDTLPKIVAAKCGRWCARASYRRRRARAPRSMAAPV